MKKIILVILIMLVGYAGYCLIIMPTSITPLPYKLKQQKRLTHTLENSDVLVIGDQMGLKLNYILSGVKEILSKQLKDPLKIYNSAKSHMGLHRSLGLIKSLKKLPPIVIYHGGSEEFFEKKFNLSRRDTIDTNFLRYENKLLLTFIKLLPILSRFIYANPQFVQMGPKIKQDLSNYNSIQKQAQMGISYKIFKSELYELVKTVKQKKSKLLFITTPINLNIAPKQVCTNSTNIGVDVFLTRIGKLEKAGKFKEAYSEANKLARVATANSIVYYRFGQLALKQGLTKEAINTLRLAASYDCQTWRSTPVFNSILTTVAKKHNIDLIDFADLLNNYLTQNNDDPFQDELFPKKVFYEQLQSLLVNKLKTLIHL
ncbi:MAG: hypothetical protein ISR65_20050 [Bacteriovoracaceae bacterium]|nr:hypothetical protein [Bacteriovoracaceae bacterium]